MIEGRQGADGFGSNVQMGDFDGDGVDDVAVGAPGDNTLGADAGTVWVVRGAVAPEG